MQRDNNEDVPGCFGATPAANDDVCYDPVFTDTSLQLYTDRGGLARGQGLFEECMFDCDADADCRAGLKCMQRTFSEPVPGCYGVTTYRDNNVCYDPDKMSLKSFVSRGDLAYGQGLFEECMYTCGEDADCQPGLKCMQRTNIEDRVPGCVGTTGPYGDAHNTCYDPEWVVKNPRSKTTKKYVSKDVDSVPFQEGRMTECMYHCSYDHDCVFPLKCVARVGNEQVPGCEGDMSPDWDTDYVCAHPKALLQECMHDCTSDLDCAGDLVCMERESGEVVPGCMGFGVSNVNNVCVDPVKMQATAHKSVVELRETQNLMNNYKMTHSDAISGSVFATGVAGTKFSYGHGPWFRNVLRFVNTYDDDDTDIPLCGGDCDGWPNKKQCKGRLKCYEIGTPEQFGGKPPQCRGFNYHNQYQDYCYDPSTASGKAQPRALLTQTAEECAALCDDTHGCTAVHWESYKCYLFHFDPSLGCTLFYDIDYQMSPIDTSNVDDAATNLAACKGDCDTGSNNCATGLKCRETEHGERVPGCKGGSHGTSDVCYDPSKMSVGFVRKPDACQLCKHYGLNSYVDAAFTVGYFLHTPYCIQEETRGDEPNTCALLPHKEDGDAAYSWDTWKNYDRHNFVHRPRCAPTRAGVESNMFTTTVYVGEEFESTPYHIMDGHPEVTTFSQCETACGKDLVCRAWQFREEAVASSTKVSDADITYANVDMLCDTSMLPWMLGQYPKEYHNEFGVKLTFTECKALCTETSACTGFRIHTGTEAPGNEIQYGCEMFQGACTIVNSASGSHWHDWLKSRVGAHSCALYDDVPTRKSVVEADSYPGSTRVGVIERDFSPKIAFFDDGENPACDCYDGNAAYNCACVDESMVPFQSKATDGVYGCSGHGKCSSLEYKCICDDGYGWMHGKDASVSDLHGHTCRKCSAGQYKNSEVPTCTRCAPGKYQDEEGKAECKACPVSTNSFGRGSTFLSDCFALSTLECAAGFKTNPAPDRFTPPFCQACAAGFYSPTKNAFACIPCAEGSYTNVLASEQCKLCPKGFAQDREGQKLCVACPTGQYSGAGAAGCTFDLCDAGQFSITLKRADCKDCPAGFFQTETFMYKCEVCPRGYYQENTKKTDCKACPSGFESANLPTTCEAVETVE
jgi:hypothetical protein